MERMQWHGKLEFLFASFGYTVGLGNIWRFPYKCYINGGGAFLIPYFLTLVFCVFPLLVLEMFLGQFASEGPITIWKFCPLFKGVGWAIIFNVFMTNISYIVIVMYSLYYLLVSFVNIGGPLPWQYCNHGQRDSWNTKNCRENAYPDFQALENDNDRIHALSSMLDSKCVDEMSNNYNGSTFQAYRSFFKACEIKFVSPEQEYWNNFVLDAEHSKGVNDLGPVIGRNIAALLIVWLIVYYCLVKGIRELSKVIYVTASFPTLLLLILLVRGLTLDGHNVGIDFYTTPDWSKLSDMAIWASAGTQAMYSVGIAFGAHIALASHNKFDNNIIRDALILGIVNTCTSILGGFVVFSFLGHASVKLNRPLDEIFDQGPGIIFISYLQGISQLQESAVWACVFFMVVFTLGVDSVFVMVWTVYVAIEDVFPKKFEQYRKILLPCLCLLLFLLGIPLVTQGGIHMFVLMDRYTADFTLTLFLILECIAVCWVYGLRKFTEDIRMMVGKIHPIFLWYLNITWAVTAPAFCVFIFLASGIGYASVSYNGIETTALGETIGILLIITPTLICIGVAVRQARKYGIRESTKPTEGWGPRLAINRTGRYDKDNDYISPVERCEGSNTDATDLGSINLKAL